MNFKKNKVIETNTYIPFGEVMPLDFTPPPYSGDVPTISCTSPAVNGNQGYNTYLVDFGFETGEAGIFYEAQNVPDKFTIIWNGQIYTSGYVGVSDFDDDMLSKGIDPSEIKTDFISTGRGFLKFNKDLSFPNVAIVIVDAPLNSTIWSWKPFCPTNSCWKTNVQFKTILRGSPSRSCEPQIKETQTFEIPTNIILPANANVYWNADDDISVNDVRLGGGCSSSRGTKNLTLNNRTVKLDLIDTRGSNWGGNISFDICSFQPPATPTPTPTSGLSPTPTPTITATTTPTPTPTRTLPAPQLLQSLYVSFD
jgi:hypothetical protein